jgi:hypothetical protein
MEATEARPELAGVNFGLRTLGLIGDPPPEILAARAWWKSPKDTWPNCPNCRPK